MRCGRRAGGGAHASGGEAAGGGEEVKWREERARERAKMAEREQAMELGRVAWELERLEVEAAAARTAAREARAEVEWLREALAESKRSAALPRVINARGQEVIAEHGCCLK